MSSPRLGQFKGSWPPQNVPRNGSKSFCPAKKNYVPHFLKERDIGNFMSFCNHGPSILWFNPGNNTKNADLNPAKYPSLTKNPPKYTTAYIVQWSNCRWHCEPTFFSGLASTMKSLFTPSLFDLSLSYLSISNPSLSKPSFSSPCQFVD
jgi:hypothetical protein